MLNKIIRFSINNRLAMLILAAVILISGTVMTLRTDIDIFPDLNATTVVVMTEAPGMAPEEVEKIVTYPIETAVNGAAGVRRVRSTSSTGFSVVWVEFDWDTDLYRARQIVSERVTPVGELLPANVKTPTMGPPSSIMGEMMIIGLTADSTSMLDLRTIADRNIRPRLLGLGGVAQVAVIGGEAKEYQVRLDPEKMRVLDVSLDEAIAAAQSVNDNASGGVIYDFGNEYIVKGEVNTTSTDDIAAAVVRSDDRGIVTLRDIATVTIAGAQPRIGAASVNATAAVLITVVKQPMVGTMSLTRTIEDQLNVISRSLPTDVQIHTDIFRQSSFIQNSIFNLGSALVEGALFVVVILFLFLMNVRTTLISVVALPISIIVTMLILHAMGYTINTMSLGGIAIAIGSLVDDAIVDVENVYKRLRENRALPPEQRRSVIDVVYHASAEVRTPIFNSSLVIIASFTPLFLLSGIEGRMLVPLGVSFIIALIASTIVALMLTPVLCVYLLGSKKAEKAEREAPLAAWLKRTYSRALAWTMPHYKPILIITGVLLIGSLIVFASMGRSFLPPFNEGSFTVNVTTLPGVSLDESNRIGREAERIILSIPEVRHTARKTGRAELDEHSMGVNASEIEAPYTLADRSREEVAHELRSKLSELPGVSIEIGQPISHRIDAMLSGSKAQIAIKLFGDDLNKLYTIGSQIKNVVAAVPGIVDANIEQQIERPELAIRPRRQMLARYGVTMADFGRIIDVAIAGKAVSQVYDDGVPYDITIVADPQARNTIESIRRMVIDTPKGKVPLSEVADIVSTAGPNTINRENVKRRILISANTEGRDLRSVINDIQRDIDASVQLPEGYYLNYGGQFESEESASRTLAWASLCSLLVILMLLYGQFKDWAQALVILLNMPLAMIGAVAILWISGGEINIPAIIGLISLLGITTRNGMLLISHYNDLRDKGEPLDRRITIGSADRLLPIIMTALTSALALIPLALNGDKPGNEIQSPMAIVILGGLVSSTILNIFIVPAVYRIITLKKETKLK